MSREKPDSTKCSEASYQMKATCHNCESVGVYNIPRGRLAEAYVYSKECHSCGCVNVLVNPEPVEKT
jgi:hypothetical protein